jgi:hypothetical protein
MGCRIEDHSSTFLDALVVFRVGEASVVNPNQLDLAIELEFEVAAAAAAPCSRVCRFDAFGTHDAVAIHGENVPRNGPPETHITPVGDGAATVASCHR